MGWSSPSRPGPGRLPLSLPALLLCAAAASATAEAAQPPAGARARFDIVVDALSAETLPLVKALQGTGAPDKPAVVHQLRGVDLADPIEKGRFLARLSHADLLVPVGDAATRFVAREFPDTPVFFVGAAVVEGSLLAGSQVAGIMAFSPELIVEAAKALGLKRVGIAFTPGYAPLVSRIASLAQAAGVSLLRSRVDSAGAIVRELTHLFEKSDAVWVLGDPVLVRGAGFQFLIEQSLARRVPVIGADPWEVERGALFTAQVSSADLAARSAGGLSGILASGLKLPEPRLAAASGGSLLYNEGVLRRFGLPLARGLPWQKVP